MIGTAQPGFPSQRRTEHTPHTMQSQSRRTRPAIRYGDEIECVDFVALCPRCGADARWTEERSDTKLQIGIDCRCAEIPPF